MNTAASDPTSQVMALSLRKVDMALASLPEIVRGTYDYMPAALAGYLAGVGVVTMLFWGIIDPPLLLHPVPDPEFNLMLTVDDAEFNLFAGMETRDELEDEIRRQVMFMWREYALEDPENLTADARQLRDTLRTRMREENTGVTWPMGRIQGDFNEDASLSERDSR